MNSWLALAAVEGTDHGPGTSAIAVASAAAAAVATVVASAAAAASVAAAAATAAAVVATAVAAAAAAVVATVAAAANAAAAATAASGASGGDTFGGCHFEVHLSFGLGDPWAPCPEVQGAAVEAPAEVTSLAAAVDWPWTAFPPGPPAWPGSSAVGPAVVPGWPGTGISSV